MTAAPPLVELNGAVKRFAPPTDVVERAAAALGLVRPKPSVLAVDGVDLAVTAGRILAVVGESGCGKSTVARIAAGVLAPTAGEVRYDGVPFRSLEGAARTRAKLKVQMVFQDPWASLNPRKRIGETVGEAPRRHGFVTRTEQAGAVADVLRRCGLDPSFADRWPHQLSGGQRQRVGIARALAVNPRALVCDEAIAALDVSIQAQILNLFLDLRDEHGLGYLFVTHDVGVVEHVADDVAVMYLGRVVEQGPADAVIADPAHPYTDALEREVPRLTRRGAPTKPIEGELPSPLAPPPGCAFHPRCPHVFARCREERPALRAVAPGRFAACHLHDGAPAGRRRLRDHEEAGPAPAVPDPVSVLSEGGRA